MQLQTHGFEHIFDIHDEDVSRGEGSNPPEVMNVSRMAASSPPEFKFWAHLNFGTSAGPMDLDLGCFEELPGASENLHRTQRDVKNHAHDAQRGKK